MAEPVLWFCLLILGSTLPVQARATTPPCTLHCATNTKIIATTQVLPKLALGHSTVGSEETTNEFLERTLLPLVMAQSAYVHPTEPQPCFGWACDFCLKCLQTKTAVRRALVFPSPSPEHRIQSCCRTLPSILSLCIMIMRPRDCLL